MRLPIIQVGDVLVSPDIITEKFCCDIEKCHGMCCVEGDAGAPVTMDEIAEIENCLDAVWNDLSASAQSVIDRQGVAYTDLDGVLVTSIVENQDCVFTCHEGDCCLCALEKSFHKGNSSFCKPISCSLYPIRERQFSNHTFVLNYHRWNICEPARIKGKEQNLPLYKFLKQPLIRRFGNDWYSELENTISELRSAGYID
ncbi:MAG: DUF3109 family protein [Prevotella sp.]|nr:DUF3109 family protein [Prevotella sp.]